MVVDFSNIIKHDIDEQYLNHLLFLTDSAVSDSELQVVEDKVWAAFGYSKEVVALITCVLFFPELLLVSGQTVEELKRIAFHQGKKKSKNAKRQYQAHSH